MRKWQFLKGILGFIVLSSIVVGPNLMGSEIEEYSVNSEKGKKGETKEYWIQAEPVIWNLMPNSSDTSSGKRFTPEETSFQAIRYFAYSSGFKTKLNEDKLLGILGPKIEANVGDTLIIHFRNNDTYFNRPHSIHPHGVFYDSDSDGSFMGDADQPGVAVAVGDEYAYKWKARKSSAGTWFYHDHSVDLVDNIERGLIGPLIVHAEGEKKAKEFVLMLSEFEPETTNLKKPFSAINGLSFLNLKLNAKVGERVRFRAFAMGSESHTVHLHGHRWISQFNKKLYVDNEDISPGSTTTFEFIEDNPGSWMLHCHFLEHAEEGMIALYVVQ